MTQEISPELFIETVKRLDEKIDSNRLMIDAVLGPLREQIRLTADINRELVNKTEVALGLRLSGFEKDLASLRESRSEYSGQAQQSSKTETSAGLWIGVAVGISGLVLAVIVWALGKR